MDFLAPLMLIGVAGAAVPLIIHLIGRRRAPIKRFGAIDFLFGTNKRVARRLRLREIILLVVRVLSCVAIPLALAKPFVSCSAAGVAVARGPQAVVILIDNSYAMGWRQHEDSLFAQAKERARHLLDELGPEADVGLAFTAEGAEAPRELTRDHLRLADAIDEARLTARPADTTQALRRAAAMLATSPHAARRIYLFSVLAATGFTPGEAPWPPGAGPGLEVVPLPDAQPLANLAITAASAEKDPDMGPRGVRVTAEIVNFGPAKVSDHGVTLAIAGRAVARGLVTLGPGEKAQKRFSATLPGDARSAEVAVEIDPPDALAIDDRRYLRVELRRDVRVLLVDGDPRTVRHDDELFYLETALRPGDRADSALAITTTTPDELQRRRLGDYDVVFLCNVKPLDRNRVADLEGWVRRGGGLFVSVGDNVEADAYNSQMGPLLAQELRTARQVAKGPKPKDEAGGQPERIGRIEATHPVFSVFSARAAGLKDANFWKVYLLGPTEKTDARTTLARFESGAPALVEAKLGVGRLLLWTSTIDRDWNDLPIHPGYLPLVQQVARYLARTPSDRPEANVVVGRAREVAVTAEDARIEITAPSGKKTTFEGAKVKGHTSVTFTEVDEPGFYHVSGTTAAEAGPKPRLRPEADFVANLDPRGSDLRRLAPADVATGANGAGSAAGAPGGTTTGAGAGPGATVGAAGAASGSASSGSAASGNAAPRTLEPPHRRIELWHGLAAALLLFLLGEAVLTRRG
jgi:aerotolerance regulator-like protein/VWA domain-containing protein